MVRSGARRTRPGASGPGWERVSGAGGVTVTGSAHTEDPHGAMLAHGAPSPAPAPGAAEPTWSAAGLLSGAAGSCDRRCSARTGRGLQDSAHGTGAAADCTWERGDPTERTPIIVEILRFRPVRHVRLPCSHVHARGSAYMGARKLVATNIRKPQNHEENQHSCQQGPPLPCAALPQSGPRPPRKTGRPDGLRGGAALHGRKSDDHALPALTRAPAARPRRPGTTSTSGITHLDDPTSSEPSRTDAAPNVNVPSSRERPFLPSFWG